MSASFTAAVGGWTVACQSCPAESWHARRPAADKWAHEHKCPKPPRAKSEQKRARAAWDNREDSTWIDKL